jgi:hypothetical protein
LEKKVFFECPKILFYILQIWGPKEKVRKEKKNETMQPGPAIEIAF